MIPFYNSVNGGPPEPITALSPIAWYRYGVGITEAATLVSAWADQSGNGNDLAQATGTNQPALQSDNSILFDGSDNYLKAVAFTLNQPETIYILYKAVTFTANDRIYDGNAANSGGLIQNVATPALRVNAGANQGVGNTQPTVGAYGITSVVLNGTSSLGQLNNGTPTVVAGDIGAANMGGFTLGADGTPANFGNIQVKEVIIFPVEHDAATRATVITYLATVGGVNL